MPLLGVVGLGRIGAEVAALGHAFGMEVVAWSENLTPDRAGPLGVRAVSKTELLETSDVMSLHLKLSARTIRVIGALELRAMRSTALLVNTARGPLVDEAALVDALRGGELAGAGLDVFDIEPLPADHPLAQLPNVVLTPHLGYVTDDLYRVFYGQAVEDVVAWARGTPVRVLPV